MINGDHLVSSLKQTQTRFQEGSSGTHKADDLPFKRQRHEIFPPLGVACASSGDTGRFDGVTHHGCVYSHMWGVFHRHYPHHRPLLHRGLGFRLAHLFYPYKLNEHTGNNIPRTALASLDDLPYHLESHSLTSKGFGPSSSIL